MSASVAAIATLVAVVFAGAWWRARVDPRALDRHALRSLVKQGHAGALAAIIVSALLTRAGIAGWLAYCGTHSIVIYLAFFFPMAATRIILLKTGVIGDVGTVSAIVTAAGVIAPLVLLWLITRFDIGWFLFRRPAWARLEAETPRRPVPQAAE